VTGWGFQIPSIKRGAGEAGGVCFYESLLKRDAGIDVAGGNDVFTFYQVLMQIQQLFLMRAGLFQLLARQLRDRHPCSHG